MSKLKGGKPMNIIVFGGTGMVGQGVLRECLHAVDVTSILSVGRSALASPHPRVRSIVHANLWDYSAIAHNLKGYDACFFCLGVASAGMDEASYTRITYDLTLAVARALLELNPDMVFVYVSGAGADSTESGSRMWARVRGKTENALGRLPFKSVYVLRPGVIQPLYGARSKTALYRIFYTALAPLLTVARRFFPAMVLSTEVMGRAMLNLVRHKPPLKVLGARDIYTVARQVDG
jgi:uncharacterized protein YbjT (DUF2867 family)